MAVLEVHRSCGRQKKVMYFSKEVHIMAELRRKYDRKFIVDAVKLASRRNKTNAQVARELAVSRNMLNTWKGNSLVLNLTAIPALHFPTKVR